MKTIFLFLAISMCAIVNAQSNEQIIKELKEQAEARVDTLMKEKEVTIVFNYVQFYRLLEAIEDKGYEYKIWNDHGIYVGKNNNVTWIGNGEAITFKIECK